MIDQLKEHIFFEAGKEIVNRGDCEHLSRLIESKTGEYINYNTLRRFFGIDKQKIKPRTSTLDILCKYIGYLSFDHFSSSQPKKGYFYQKLKMYDLLNTFDPLQLSAYFNGLDANYNMRINFVVQVCRQGLLLKQTQQLCTALKMMNFHNPPFSYDEKLIIGNSIGLIFRGIDMRKKDWKILYENSFFNEYIFEIFVDYSSLNKYYLGFIKYKPIAEEQRHFKMELLTLHHFLNNKLSTSIGRERTSSETEALHPILRGRILSRHLYDGTANTKIFPSLASMSNEFLYEPMVASIISSNFIWYDSFQKKLNLLVNPITFRGINYFQVYLLMKTCFLYKSKEISKAISVLNEIELEALRFGYREMLSFFYYLLDHKLNNNEYSRLQAENLSQKFNYPRFDQEYIRLY